MANFLFAHLLVFSNLVFADKCLPVIDQGQSITEYNYLIVPGVFNEILTGYMTEYRPYLNISGVEADNIKKLNNSSITHPLHSAAALKKKIESFNNDNKVIILSHSKGALESLVMLLEYPEIRPKIQKLILIQGPLQGVSSYELTYGESSKQIAKDSIFFRFYKKIASLDFISSRFKNFAKSSVIKSLNYDLLKKEELLDKLIFVRTHKKVSEMNWKMRYVGGLYRDYLGEKSDGVVLWEEQLPEGVDKTNSCVVEKYADHGDFVKVPLFGKSKKRTQIRQFLDFIFFGNTLPAKFSLKEAATP